MNEIWSDAEKNFIKANCHRLKDDELAATLSRLSGRVITTHSVRHIRQNLGIKKKSGRGVCKINLSLKSHSVPLHLNSGS